KWRSQPRAVGSTRLESRCRPLQTDHSRHGGSMVTYMSQPTHSTLSSIPGGRVSYSDSTWQPIRNHFGITAFGINAYTAARAGDSIIGDHDHADPSVEQHQELYFVHAGAARFVVDGLEVDAPAGTFVSAHDVTTRRSATRLT